MSGNQSEIMTKVKHYADSVEHEYKGTAGPNLQELIFWSRTLMASVAQAESSSGKTSSDVSYLKKVGETLKAEIRVFKQKEERLKTDLLPLMIEEIKAFKVSAGEIAAEHAVAPEPTQKLKSLADKFAAKLVMIFSKL